jgi:formylglycine-generating enzyme required for sulfatase activity
MRTRTCVAFCLLLTAAFSSHAETRVALVIGNGAYDSGALANPVSDAQLLRDTLKADGFTVTYLANADRGQMVRAIQALGQQLVAGGKEAVGLFYFSGHGVQSEGHNFLLPVRASLQSTADLLPEAVDAEWVLKQMEEAHNGLNIIILDACRNNPLPVRMRAVLKGLAVMQAPPGSVVAFATDAGSVASDGTGHNSPYAGALARYMQQPGLELQAMFKVVAQSVYDATKNTSAPQIPVQTYKLTPTFYFRAASVQPVAGPPPTFDPRAAELAIWQSAERLGTAEAYRDYLSRYPDGQFSTQAKLQLAALTRPATGGRSSASSAASASSGSMRPFAVFRDCANCPEMVQIPAGSFVMGSPENEKGRDSNEGPQHNVHVPSFSIGKYVVTFDEWDACVAAHGCSTNPSDEGWGRDRRPVIHVSWNDAQEYVRWLTTKTGHKYRLPSEAEWEYAARAGTTTIYYWGNDIGQGHANCKDCLSQWDGNQTAPVGSFAPNPWGLYDMLGNVWQWTQDCWQNSYKGAPNDGRAWEADNCDYRVERGGAWNDTAKFSRVTARDDNAAGKATFPRGFRLARD